ncbi:DASH complex subunit DAD1 [Entomortierella parvispora]|uniref:DASH complex subunit DAD1 n=1 Tax=Entomortierella parvispora TaxID=205924 RepID=A0A9P3LS77_9FUNG|nr:DASH complex subunit DAD1 [Entomortierella parvispora]
MAVAQQGSAGDTAAFEAERSRLVSDINMEMSQVIANVNNLNRSLETIITIGQEFEQLSQLWKNFHASASQLNEGDDIYSSRDPALSQSSQ